MNTKYVLHYGDYAVAENEHLYTEMAAQGWHFVKRGQRLSRFEKGTPTRDQYRIELLGPGLMDDEMAEKAGQKGWELAAANGLVHIFRGSGKKKLPALGDGPEQKAVTLKALRRDYRTGFAVSILSVAFMAMMTGGSLTRWLMFPEFYLLLGAILFMAIGTLAYGAVRTMVLYKQLRAGTPIDHDRTGNVMGRKVGIYAVCSLFVCLLLLCGLTVLRSTQYDMPDEADGPYLTLSDLGWEGEPMADPQSGEPRPDTVQHENNLFAEVWDTYEGVTLGAEQEAWMYTTVYRLKAGWLEKGMDEYLAAGALFVKDLAEYTPVEGTGFDAAYRVEGGFEYIAVKDDMAWYILYADPGNFSPAETPERDVLAALAARMQ